MVATGWLPRPTNSREGRPNLAASAAAGPGLELAPAVVLLPDELPEVLEGLELVEPLVVLVLPLGALEPTDVVVPVELLETPAPCNPLEPVVLAVLAVLVVLVEVLVEAPEAPVASLAVDVDEVEVPPQAARVSATMQQAALGSTTRNFGKTGIRLNRGLPPF